MGRQASQCPRISEFAYGEVGISRSRSSRSSCGDGSLLLVLLVLLVLLQYLLLQSTWAARIRLHRQVASIPVVTWSPLHHQAPCDGAGGVTHVDVGNLLAGGWPVDKQRIFVRPQVAGQWRRLQGLLEDEDHSTLKVEGPPGTGKSTVAWAWACHLAGHGHAVVWVHRWRNGSSCCAVLGGGVVSHFSLESEREAEIMPTARRLAAWATADVLVVDGVTRQSVALLDGAARWAKSVRGRRAATVSSVQVYVTPEDADEYRLSNLQVYSWTKAEYLAACAEPEFWRQVRPKLGWVDGDARGEIDDRNEHEPPFAMMDDEQYQTAVIEQKFRVAGHCARWMFYVSVRDLVGETIPTSVQRVGNFHTLAQGLVGVRAEVAVNQLVSAFTSSAGDSFQLVSRMVTRYVSQYCELAFVTSAANAVGDANAAFDGWVLELEFLCRVRLAQTHNNDRRDYVRVYESDAEGNMTELQLPVNRRVMFRQTEDVAHCDIAGENDVATWFIPLVWNQGGYDAAMYRDGCLYFFQITRNTAHTEKWTPMNALALAVHDRLVQQGVADGLQFVEHIFVLPPNLVGDFVFRTPQQINSIPAWRDTHTRKVAFVRVAGGGNAPEAAGNEIITSRGQALNQEGGIFPRAPGNHDWRRNFPLRPE